MTRYIALLRGINVSGQKLIKMEVLNKVFVSMGFENVKTYIQSGNVIFDTSENDPALLTKKIEAQLLALLGFEITVILRTVPQLSAIVAHNPFKQIEADKNISTYITFLAQVPDKALQSVLLSFQNEAEIFHIDGCEVFYLGYKDKAQKLLFSNNFIEKKLKQAATTRNWNTVQKLLILCSS